MSENFKFDEAYAQMQKQINQVCKTVSETMYHCPCEGISELMMLAQAAHDPILLDILTEINEKYDSIHGVWLYGALDLLTLLDELIVYVEMYKLASE